MNEPRILTFKGVVFYRHGDGQYYGHPPKILASRPQASEPEQAVRYEPLATPGIPGCGKRRLLLRISQFTRRRQDPDNCAPKYEIDALRRLYVIPDDSDDDIELQIRQIQVTKEEDEGILMEIL